MQTHQIRFIRFGILSCMLILTSCNLYGGLDHPSGDPQVLAAARAAFDQGNYEQAKTYYQALSNSQSDIILSETALTNLAEINVFSISDLIQSLGSNRGSTQSLTSMANLIAQRGATAASLRTTIQSIYASLSGIENVNLRSFIQFLTAMAMTNQLLASAVGSDGQLSITNLVTSSACGTSNCVTSSACDMPAGSALVNDQVVSDPTSLSLAANWSTSASLEKLQIAISAAAVAASTLGISGLSGIAQDINALNSSLGSISQSEPYLSQCKRQVLINSIF